MAEHSGLFRLLVRGDHACFARPEMKVERVSYPIITPAACRGVVESIFWKPEIAWRIERIDRLRPPRFMQIRRNEVAVKASRDRPFIQVEAERQQRAALVLRDVAYVLHATMRLTPKGAGEPLAKYIDMFRRRAEAGQCFQRPCLGVREFPADFRLLTDGEADPLPEGAAADEDLGWLFYDFDYTARPYRPRFFAAHLKQGRLLVPRPDSVGLRT